MKAILKFVVPAIMCIAVFCSMLALNPHIGYYDFAMVSEAMETSFEPALTALQYSRITFDVIEILDETLREANGGPYRIAADVSEIGGGEQRIWVEGAVWSLGNGWKSVSTASLDVPATGRVDPQLVQDLTDHIDVPLFGLPASPFTAFAGIAVSTGFLIGKGTLETLHAFVAGVCYIIGVSDSPY